MTPLERRELARTITRLADATVGEALSIDAAAITRCPLIGITGPPGVGKSSLIAKLALCRVASRDSLAILAIDPTSPLSGGAILGDRIRMGELVDDDRIFVRSLATRGSHDGLADNLPLIIDCIGRAGFAEAIVETVGVGQVEYAIRGMSDTMLLVLSPGAGDRIQAMKSGISEIPDIFVVNKADLAGADSLVSEIKAILHLKDYHPDDWSPMVVKVSAERVSGIAEVSDAIDQHRAWLMARGPSIAQLSWRRVVLQNLVARCGKDAIGRLDDHLLNVHLRSSFLTVLDQMSQVAKRASFLSEESQEVSCSQSTGLRSGQSQYRP